MKEKTQESAYEALKKLIVSNTLDRKEPLIEEELATRLGISRTPLREAMAKLASEGILVKDAARGSHYINRVTLESLFEIYDMREVIEGLAARLLSYRMDDEMYRQFVGLAEKLDAITGTVEDDNRFHEQVVKLSGNKIAYETIRKFHLQAFAVDEYTHSLRSKGTLMVPDEHEECSHVSIIKAISGHNGEAAEATARSHVRLGKETILYCLRIGMKVPL